MADLTWTDEMVDMLKSDRASGLSFGVITSRLTRAFPNTPVSRNAVIGKANRIGLPRVQQPTKSPTPARSPAQAKGGKGGAKPAPAKAPPKPFAPKPVIDLASATPPDGGITFMQIRDGLCRWPISQETSFDLYRACGCPCEVTLRYCATHQAKSRDAWRTRDSETKAASVQEQKETSRLRNINTPFFIRKQVA